MYGELIDLIEFWKYIIFEPLDIQIVDKKNGTRVSVDMNWIDWPKIYFDESEDTSSSWNENASSSTGGNVSSWWNNGSSDDNVSTWWNNNSSDNNSSSSSINNCVDIKVDDWKSYNFCIYKAPSYTSKFAVSVSDAEDLTSCTVWKAVKPITSKIVDEIFLLCEIYEYLMFD